MRGVGIGAAGVGLAVIGVSVVAAIDLPGWLQTALIIVFGVVAVVAFVLLTVGVLRALGWGPRLVIDDDGFHNATGPRSGERRVAWRDVRKVQADGPVVSVDLAGSKQSLIRTSPLEVEPKALAQELRSRLNTDRGYRPISSTRRKS